MGYPSIAGQGRKYIGAGCPTESLVWEACDDFIGDTPWGVIPFGRVLDAESPPPAIARNLSGGG